MLTSFSVRVPAIPKCYTITGICTSVSSIYSGHKESLPHPLNHNLTFHTKVILKCVITGITQESC